ncbi:CDP-alcohol phosphatidyltransferase-domain-containing protein [Bombardia bombarda]|uniref:CDP-alcohol phosphatidyltransferase-domain-containing protein n=1 Tax=Bombardia bombarda TaxID=252184 RepID=A0AA40BVZ7_9PEZI|nr:CDP-alcohol phosphatidyltransferase-domain-containing protein [Bombardia bombarda]
MSGPKTRRQAAKDKDVASYAEVVKKDASAVASKAPKQENIFLFVPNIIGYSRIILAIASLYYMPFHPRTCCALYSVSCLLDALDGYAARYLDQSTRFGAVLDMVTDRCSTACLLVFLSSAFPRWIVIFQCLISLDLASHYVHIVATLTMGGSDESHKNVDKSRSWLLNLYYTNRTVLFIFCLLNELFFIALYLLSFSSPLLSPGLLKQAPDAAKVIFNNPYSAGALELARANKMDSTIPWILCVVSAPVMLMKQFINVVQLVKASRWLAEGDVQARRERGLPRNKRSN